MGITCVFVCVGVCRCVCGVFLRACVPVCVYVERVQEILCVLAKVREDIKNAFVCI